MQHFILNPGSHSRRVTIKARNLSLFAVIFTLGISDPHDEKAIAGHINGSFCAAACACGNIDPFAASEPDFDFLKTRAAFILNRHLGLLRIFPAPTARHDDLNLKARRQLRRDGRKRRRLRRRFNGRQRRDFRGIRGIRRHFRLIGRIRRDLRFISRVRGDFRLIGRIGRDFRFVGRVRGDFRFICRIRRDLRFIGRIGRYFRLVRRIGRDLRLVSRIRRHFRFTRGIRRLFRIILNQRRVFQNHLRIAISHFYDLTVFIQHFNHSITAFFSSCALANRREDQQRADHHKHKSHLPAFQCIILHPVFPPFLHALHGKREPHLREAPAQKPSAVQRSYSSHEQRQ